MEYTKEDIEDFKADPEACPAHLLGSNDEEYVQWMKKLNWQPPNIIIESEKENTRPEEEDTVPQRYSFSTSWVITNKAMGIIMCNNCKIFSSLDSRGNPPYACPCCNLPTDKNKPITT
ncbi:hypothetical protein L6259_01255 [Candidatus Parcubacteria bacterium]|nr:hypothetical protein [Patescibacteria group bacterium]MCG2693893.1 hypothetical protein [Candidatus Parcubacteria bacterium]